MADETKAERKPAARLEDDGDGLRCAWCRSPVTLTLESIREHYKCEDADAKAHGGSVVAGPAGIGLSVPAKWRGDF